MMLLNFLRLTLWAYNYSSTMFPNLLKVTELLTIKFSENPSYLKSKFSILPQVLWISKFWGSTSRLLVEHLWSPEQWLGTTALAYVLYIAYRHIFSQTFRDILIFLDVPLWRGGPGMSVKRGVEACLFLD